MSWLSRVQYELFIKYYVILFDVVSPLAVRYLAKPASLGTTSLSSPTGLLLQTSASSERFTLWDICMVIYHRSVEALGDPPTHTPPPPFNTINPPDENYITFSRNGDGDFQLVSQLATSHNVEFYITPLCVIITLSCLTRTHVMCARN